MERKATALESGRRVLEIEAQAVSDLAKRLDESFDRAVEILNDCQGRVVVTGMGKSGIISQKIAATFSSTGSPAYFMHPAEALHGDLGMLVSGDVLLALSNSGETPEVVRLLELVRRLGAHIVAMSGDPNSTLARHADVHLDVSVSREACSLDLAPTASTTTALAMGDALAVACYERAGFTPTDFARYHPGGRLARRLLQVESLMHKDSELPRVLASATLTEALEQIDAKKLGMTCVADTAGKLCGVLTDGDLRRLMLRSGAPMELSLEDVMIRTPAVIRPGALASEALKVMEERKITSLPVVDGQGRLLGVIQIHDLWRTELF